MVNRVILIGNLGSDPEVRVLESGVKMARVRIATNEVYTSATGLPVRHTEWHNVVLWRSAADYAQKQLVCGSYVRVEGCIRSRESTEVNGHPSRTIYEIVSTDIELLRNDALATVESPQSVATPIAPAPEDPDSLPF